MYTYINLSKGGGVRDRADDVGGDSHAVQDGGVDDDRLRPRVHPLP